MAFFDYSIDIEHVSGQDTLVSITVNGTVYTPAVPFVMSALNAPAIVAWLQSTIPAYLWLSEYSTNAVSDLSYLNIYTACISESAHDTITAEVILTEVPEVIAATYENCGSTTCGGITAVISAALEIDCDNQCLNFTDTTGIYNALTNAGGYGNPNFPAIVNIVTVRFTLLNQSGSTLGAPYTTTYRPTAVPFASICLTAANFGYAGFVGNTTYQLKYTIITDSAITCSPLQIPFVMPCCGSILTNGLVTSFQLQQQPSIAGNPTPTPTQLTFVDTTYAYSTDNPGGYGSPNPAYSDVSHTEFVVTRPDGQVVAFDIGYVPNALNNVAVITNENLGYADGPIADGVYKFVYNVYATPASSECLLAQTVIYTLFFRNTFNCLFNQGISLLSGCDIKKKLEWSANWNELDMIKAASLGNIQCVVGKVERLLARCQVNCPTC